MNKQSAYKIAVLPGDGIGIDVAIPALEIFEVLNLPISFELGTLVGHAGRTKAIQLQKSWELIQKCDTTLLGAITSMPKKEAEKALPKLYKIKA